jgi:transposase-like protein
MSRLTKTKPKDIYPLFYTEEGLVSIAKRHKIAVETLRKWWVEEFGKRVVESKLARNRLARSKIKPEDTYTAFHTSEGFKVVAARFSVSPNTLRKWWTEKFGKKAFDKRSQQQHHKGIFKAIESRIVLIVNGKKRCGKCGVFKKTSEFNKAYGKIVSWCKSCANSDPNKKEGIIRYHQRRSEFINSLKNHPCADCGKSYPPYCMEFDHVRGKKIASVAILKYCSMARILKEITKCDIVCANCHRVRTQSKKTHKTTRPKNRIWLNSLKNSLCKDCGNIYPPVAMDFDHVRGIKVKGVGSMQNWGRQKILAEIAKCELVCANCHRKRTYSKLKNLNIGIE